MAHAAPQSVAIERVGKITNTVAVVVNRDVIDVAARYANAKRDVGVSTRHSCLRGLRAPGRYPSAKDDPGLLAEPFVRTCPHALILARSTDTRVRDPASRRGSGQMPKERAAAQVDGTRGERMLRPPKRFMPAC